MIDPISGLFVLWIELSDGKIQRFWEWEATERNHADCEAASAYWKLATHRWAECGQEL
jgi:hypothetical protein